MALTFGMETREGTVQFRRRTSVSGTIGRSAVDRPPPRKTVLILVGGAISESPTSSLREVIMPRQVFPLGIASHCPRPSGGGGGGRRPGGGGGSRYRPLPGPHPLGDCPPRSPARGEPGDTPRSPLTLRWVGTIIRTDMGVQQGLSLADSQSGTQCTHGCVRANGGNPLSGPHLPGRARRAGCFHPCSMRLCLM